jgi:adenine-specific DNA-methyltransferase
MEYGVFNMLNHVLQQTDNYINSKSKTERKKTGQFFTSRETALFMASLFDIPMKSKISILDPGAGTGILSAAIIERMQTIKEIDTIYLTCYENNPETVKLLNENLNYIKMYSKVSFDYKIVSDNYITSQQFEFNGGDVSLEPMQYDLIISNPPYLKIPKDAPEAVAMPIVCYGAPNLYFLFASMSLFNLHDGGEMVYIIPRSWTSGAYFRSFRNYLLFKGKLINIHLFVSRDKVFDKESVLQETIIIKVCKQKNPVSDIVITSSKSNSDFKNITTLKAPYSSVVAGKENYVFLITSKYELDTLEKLNTLQYTLPSIGMKMKTGLTVDFRNRNLLRNFPGENIVPMFYSQHIQDGNVVFPVRREFEYISDELKGLIQENKNYLFVKRFTAKEEKRRLQSGIYLSTTHSEYKAISTQNKINFIDCINGDTMKKETLYGLYAIFNSTIYDLYYRILNGSTQVNSSEINTMPMPDLQTINEIGTNLIKANSLSTNICDKLLEVIQ